MRAYRSLVNLRHGPSSSSPSFVSSLLLQPTSVLVRAKKDFHYAPTQFLQISANIYKTAGGDEDVKITPAEILKHGRIGEIVSKLNDSERISLRRALDQYDLEHCKSSNIEELAANKWHARVGQPHTDKIMSSDIDGNFKTLVMLVNAVPFIGFGFLDNFFMIIAGDYIEHTLGIYMCISTMAAAGLGNTISDVMGLGLAHYVELFCEFIGLRPPRLTPAQLELTICRRVSSFGRAIGITVGCLLGMFPLWFINKKPKKDDGDENGNEDKNLNQTTT